MTNQIDAGNRMRPILVLVATIATIAFNWMAAVGLVGGVTPEVISDRYPTVVTPAGYAFSIWSLIYLGLISFSIYQLRQHSTSVLNRVRTLYLVSCVLNCAWIYFWHREQIAVCLLLIMGLLATLLVIVINLKGSGLRPLFTTAPFSIYAGWVTAASLVNLAVLLKANELIPSLYSWNVIGVLILLVSAAAAVVFRLKNKLYLYPMPIAWAATAIAVNQSGNTAIVVAASICVIVCLLMSVSFVMDQKAAGAVTHG
jgi:translocator protein